MNPYLDPYRILVVTNHARRRRWLVRHAISLPGCTFAEGVDSVPATFPVMFERYSKIDMLIVDLALDHEVGYELIRTLSCQPSMPPILAIDGPETLTPAVCARHALLAGAFGYLAGEEVRNLLTTAVHQIINRGTIFLTDTMKCLLGPEQVGISANPTPGEWTPRELRPAAQFAGRSARDGKIAPGAPFGERHPYE